MSAECELPENRSAARYTTDTDPCMAADSTTGLAIIDMPLIHGKRHDACPRAFASMTRLVDQLHALQVCMMKQQPVTHAYSSQTAPCCESVSVQLLTRQVVL